MNPIYKPVDTGEQRFMDTVWKKFFYDSYKLEIK